MSRLYLEKVWRYSRNMIFSDLYLIFTHFDAGFCAWADHERLNDPSNPLVNFRTLPCATEAILRGHLMSVYDIVEDCSALRVYRRIKGHHAYKALQSESGRVWQNANGIMSESVMKYARGRFLDRMKTISDDMGWVLGNRECNPDFVQAVAEYHGDDGGTLEWMPEASNTPCLCVNVKTRFSFENRQYSSFDGSSPDRICKSDVNIFDLFRVVACDGDVLVLKQKNKCSISLVPTLVSGGSKKYIFEIGGVFDSCGTHAFLYFTNGIVCDPIRWVVRSTDNQYRFCEGTLNVARAAIACRFRVPYAMVSDFLLEKREDGFNAMTGDHCDIDSGNNSMWNLRLATMSEQNANKNGDGFVFSFFSEMEDGDQEIIVNGFYTARARRQIYRLHCPSGESVSIDGEGSNLYQEMQEVGGAWNSVWYFDTDDGDTIFLRSWDPYETFDEGYSVYDIQFLSMRMYVTRRLCDVSDCAANQRYAQMTIDGVKISVSRSLAFSNVLHRGDSNVQCLRRGGVNYVQVRDGNGNDFHVHHINAQPRHNFSNNLAIITQSENNSYAQENIRVKDQLQGTRGVSLVFNNNGRLVWSHTRPPMSHSVTSFREASSFRRLWGSDEDVASSFLYSLTLRDWDRANEEEVSHDEDQPLGPHAAAEHEEDLATYSFDLYSSNGIESVQWSLSRLQFELLRRNVVVTMKKLQNLVKGRSRCSRGVQCNARKMAVHLIGSDGRPLNRIVLSIRNRSEGTD